MQLTTRCHNLNRQASLKQTQIQCKSVLALHTDNNTVSHRRPWSINLCHMMISLSETDWFIISTDWSLSRFGFLLIYRCDQNKAPVKTLIPPTSIFKLTRQNSAFPQCYRHISVSVRKQWALTSSPETEERVFASRLQQNSTCVLLKRGTITTFWEKHWKSCHLLMQLPADLCTTATRPKSSQHS